MYFHSLQSGGSSDSGVTRPSKPWYRKAGDALIYGSRVLNAGRNLYRFVKNPLHWFAYDNDQLAPPFEHPEDMPGYRSWTGFGRYHPNNWLHQRPNDGYFRQYYEEGVNVDNAYNDPHHAYYRTKEDTYIDRPGEPSRVKRGEWGPWTPYRSFEDLQDFFVYLTNKRFIFTFNSHCLKVVKISLAYSRPVFFID